MSSEATNRTFIGTVVCVDLVGYSTKSTEHQTTIKQVFNRLLAQALRAIPEDERIILDTGDGAAISFLGDPEASLAVAIAIQKAMLARGSELGSGSGKGEAAVRMGINLGPVRLAADMNGYPRIIGDGISVAEKIMSFAQPGQLVASRSFHDMVSRVSDANAAMFRFEGVRTDKNVRDHEIYVIDSSAKPVKSTKPARDESYTIAKSAEAEPAVASSGGLAGFLRDRFKVGFAALVLVALIVAESVLLAFKSRAPDPAVASAPAPAASAPVAAPNAIAPPVSSPPPAPAADIAKAPEKPAVKAAPPAIPAASEPPKAVAAVPAKSAPEAPKPAPELPKPAAAAPAKPASEPPKAAVEPAKPAKAVEAKPAAARSEPRTTDSAKPARKAEPVPVPVPAPAPAPAPEPPKEEPKVVAPAPTATVTLLSRAPVTFPIQAATRRIDAGSVNARLTLDANGGVKAVKITGSTSRFFEEESTRALKLYKFNPGLDGRTYDVEIAFQR